MYTVDTTTCASPLTVYGTTEGKIIDSGEVYYKQVETLTEGGRYIFADNQSEGKTKILAAQNTGSTLAHTTENVIEYNSNPVHLRQPENPHHKIWVFENVKSKQVKQPKKEVKAQ